MKRTGCIACPFATSRFEEELDLLKQHEPKLYVAANNVFGEAHNYTRNYKEYRDSFKNNTAKMSK